MPTTFPQHNQSLVDLAFSVPPSQCKRYRNINLFPIDYASQPRLRGRLTLLRLTLAGTLGLPAGKFFTPLVVTHVSIRTSDISSMLLNSPSQTYRTLPYHAYKICIRSFGSSFSPVTSSAQADSTSELLRFL
jgi:hypothetical protein